VDDGLHVGLRRCMKPEKPASSWLKSQLVNFKRGRATVAHAVVLPLRLEPSQWKTRRAQGQTPMQRLPELMAGPRRSRSSKISRVAVSTSPTSWRVGGGRRGSVLITRGREYICLLVHHEVDGKLGWHVEVVRWNGCLGVRPT